MLRVYAALVGVALVVLGAGGLLGIWDVTPTEEHLFPDDILYLSTGFLFSYLGFARKVSTAELQTVVVGMGVLYALAGGTLALSWYLLGLFVDWYEVEYYLGHVAFGILNVAAGWFLSRDKGSLSS